MRVLVAMSGGVDSSVAAALLRDQGHDVVGCTLRLWGGPSDTGCCSVSDVDDARRVAQVLGIDHHVFNLEVPFEQRVVAPYVASHHEGTTPNPCVECNRAIKFGVLLERAERLGFDAIATGHHARLRQGPSGPELRRGGDRAKDQSYVLGVLDDHALTRTLLPVGEHTKGEVRELALLAGLRTAAKPDSQDVCFVPRGGRAGFLGERLSLSAARVVDLDGTERGAVAAAQLVTVGQRRGVARGEDGTPRYVVDVDVTAGVVSVARAQDALVSTILVEPGSLRAARGVRLCGRRVLVQTSAHGAPANAVASPDALELLQPVRPVAPGQLAVLYEPRDPDLVVGSATVARRRPAP